LLTLEKIIHSKRLREAVRSSPLGPHIDEFVKAASAVGYTPRSLYDLILGASHFARYLTEVGITDVKQIGDREVRDFIKTLPVSKCRTKYLMPSVRGSRAARKLLDYLRSGGIVPPEPIPVSSHSWILDTWIDFLRQHRGLAVGSVELYRRNVDAFLQWLHQEEVCPERFAGLSSARVREYLQSEAPRFGRSARKNLVITLRTFLRYAFMAGHLSRDVASTLERVPCFTLDRLPRGPKWEDLPKLLETVDRSTAAGRRDFVVLLVLITYGIRASQLTALRMDDLRWRDGQIVVPPAKRGRTVVVPMTTSVGNALLDYIRDGRPVTPAREVFLSLDPPFNPLLPGSLYNIVSRAFRLSGITSPHRGSHAIRHAWATRALAQGQRLKTLADLLGHHALESTRIYTKVDYTQLRSVALRWPAEVRP
jgi:site-specific recombinase XerD